jgi:hypothetical protein
MERTEKEDEKSKQIYLVRKYAKDAKKTPELKLKRVD